MIQLVVDASVAVNWFVSQEHTQAARELLSKHTFIAPSFIVLEVASVLLRETRRGNVSEATSQTILTEHLPETVDFWDDFPSLAPTALTIATTHGGALYDACYIALAQQLNMPLATADRQQASIAQILGLNVRLIG